MQKEAPPEPCSGQYLFPVSLCSVYPLRRFVTVTKGPYAVRKDRVHAVLQYGILIVRHLLQRREISDKGHLLIIEKERDTVRGMSGRCEDLAADSDGLQKLPAFPARQKNRPLVRNRREAVPVILQETGSA